MRTYRIASGLCALLALGSAVATPLSASAQSLADQSKRRQQKKNEWRNLSIGAGAVGLYGLLKGDKTLAIAGIGGGLYSLNRYEQDRKSQSKIDHQRAELFSRSSIRRNGHRYVRKTVKKNGTKYYTFVRAD